jgi:NAD-dependent SIR2 family protein deacetylase
VACTGSSSPAHEPGTVRQAECITCHEADHKSARDPPHDSLPTTCQDCHSERQWVPGDSSTIHAPLRESCGTCHQSDPQPQTIFHTQLFDTECASCHRSYPGWTPADFLHAPVPRTCLDCHADLRPDTPTHQAPQGQGDCASCHIVTDWTITDPATIHALLPASCVACHENDPQPQTIFHTQVFDTECASCHRNYPDWTQTDFLHAPVPGTCGACHSDLRPATQTHQSAAGLGDCAGCHVVTDWATTDPAAIHTPPPASCVTCHRDDPQPQTLFHTQLFDTECASCHRSYPDWTSADFLHSPVPGACNACHSDLRPNTPTHRSAMGLGDCARCHVVNDWTLTDPIALHTPLPAACIGCHGQEPRSNDPFHTQTFDPECANCHHSYPGWTPAAFAHLPKPTRCYDCHESERPTASAHPGIGDCLGCHATSAWTPATGGTHPENAFPIQADEHSVYRNDCASCHNVALGSPVGGENADCVGCHDGQHTRANVDFKHDEVPFYPQGAAPPNFCLDCHSDGRN